MRDLSVFIVAEKEMIAVQLGDQVLEGGGSPLAITIV
jgi:hypothetical protein